MMVQCEYSQHTDNTMDDPEQDQENRLRLALADWELAVDVIASSPGMNDVDYHHEVFSRDCLLDELRTYQGTPAQELMDRLRSADDRYRQVTIDADYSICNNNRDLNHQSSDYWFYYRVQPQPPGNGV